MAIPDKHPRWADDPSAGFPGAVEPSEGKKDDGFDNGERAAAGHFNWLFRKAGEWTDYLANEIWDLIEAVGLTRPTLGGDAGRLVRALQLADFARVLGASAISYSGTNELHAAFAPNTINARVYAVGENATILRLTDAGAWVVDAPASGYTGAFRAGVGVDTGSFGAVLVGDAEEIQTTFGGITRRRTGAETLHAVATNGSGGVIAVGNAATILHSTTPATWNSRTSAHAGEHLYGIAYGAGVWVAVGEGGIQSSADGITWTSRVAIGGANAYRSVVYIAGFGFVAVVDAGSNSSLSTSVDGVTWASGGSLSGTSIMKLCGHPAGLLCFTGAGVQAAQVVPLFEVAAARIYGTDEHLWKHACYSPFYNGMLLAGEDGVVGYSATPFGVE